MTFGDLNITLSEKCQNSFQIIFDELSNAVFRLALRCLGAELKGGGVETPPRHGEGGAEHRHGAGYIYNGRTRI